MARIRQIKPEFYLDDELARCPRDARLMFPGLWCLADRAGRLEDRPARIKAQLFPYDEDIRVTAVEEFLTILAEHGFIQRYEAVGKRYIQIRTFVRHQHIHIKEGPSQIPPPQLLGETHSNTVPEPDQDRSSRLGSTSTSGYMGNGSSSGGMGEGKKPSASRKKNTPPAHFVLTEELRKWTEGAAPGLDPERELEKFIDYYRQEGKRSADWPASWRNWIRIAVDLTRRARSPTGRRESTADHNARVFQEVEAEERGRS